MINTLVISLAVAAGILVCDRFPKVAKPFCFALIIRISVALFGYYVGGLPYAGDDAVSFEYEAWHLSQAGFLGLFNIQAASGGGKTYIQIIAFIYLLIGRYPLSIVILNAFLGSLVTLNIYYITKILWKSRRLSLVSAWMISFYPSLILLSSVGLREAPIHFFSTLAILFLIKWIELPRVFIFCGFVASAIVASLLHSTMIFLILIVLIVFLKEFLSSLLFSRSRRLQTGLIIALCITSVVMAISLGSGVGTQKFSKLIAQGPQNYIFLVSDSQRARARDRASYLTGLRISSPSDFVSHTPVRTVYFLYTPFPWMIVSPTDIFGFFDALLYLWLTLLICLHLKLICTRRASGIVLLATVFIISVLAISTSNYGAALRHRAKVAPMLICLLPSYTFSRSRRLR